MTGERIRFSRSDLLRLAVSGAAACAVPGLAARGRAANAEAPMTADAALDLLLAGNRRFAAGRPAHGHWDATRRTEAASGQRPFAIVLGCSDSRVAPEVIFDQGIGDVFTIRAAGNVADHAGIGSIQYAVGELKAPLLVVLGHSKCGAVAAAVELVKHGTSFPGDIQTLATAIAPAVREVAHEPGDLVDHAVSANVRFVAKQLARAPVLADAVKSAALKIVGARYSLSSGMVELLD